MPSSSSNSARPTRCPSARAASARRCAVSSTANTSDVHAVQQVSFSIRPGEIVGFLGPNGAGKTTTLKMLSGLLHPTAGKARVLGFTPWERKRGLPAVDDPGDGPAQPPLLGHPRRRFLPAQPGHLPPHATPITSSTLKELDELLELAPILRKPVRNLSLGERMKCELAAGLLHRPAGALPGRADHRPGYHRPGAHPHLPAGIQPPHRRHHPAHQPLHGRCDRAVRADHHHPPRPAQIRRRHDRSVAPHRALQADRRGAGRRPARAT